MTGCWGVFMATAMAMPPTWDVDERAWYLEDVTVVTSDEASLQVESGYAFAVVDPDGLPGGLALIGHGTLTLRFPDGLQDAVALNRFAALDAEQGVLAAIEQGAGWDAPLDTALVLGSEVALPSSARPITRDGSVVLFTRDDGQEEVLVTDLPGLGTARRRARMALNERSEAWGREALDPAAPAILDRLEGREGTRWLAGVRVLGSSTAPWVTGRWLTWTHDPSGVIDPGVLGAVRPGATTTGPALSAKALPLGPTGRPGAPQRIALHSAGVTSVARVMVGGQAADIGVAADVVVQAIGRDASVVVVDVPHIEPAGWFGSPPVPSGYELVSVEDAEGEALQVTPLALTADQRDNRGQHRTIAVSLPTPLPAGAQTTVRIRWRDRTRYAHLLQGASLTLLDITTGVVRVLPTVRGHDGTPMPVRVHAGVVSGVASDDVVAGGRELSRQPSEEGAAWVDTLTTSAGAVMAAGRFRHHRVAGSDRVPAVEARVQLKSNAVALARDTAVLARAVDPHVPSWPETLHLVDAGAVVDMPGQAVSAGGGVLSLHQTWDWAHVLPPARVVLTQAVLMDRWLETAPSGEAAEVAQLASHLSAWWVLQASDDDEGIDYWRAAVSGDAKRGVGSLVPQSTMLSHRLVVSMDALPERFGLAAVQQAFTELLAGRYPTSWEGLSEALTEASGQDAEPFVTLWLASGVRPTFDITWHHDPDGMELVAEVVSDAPRGAHPLHLTVHGPPGKRSVVVPMRDGVGEVRVPWERSPRRISVDASALPLRRVQVNEAQAAIAR